ncbi:MAG: glycoside hydrolase family 88 protein [Prolixibacteraceae bacterium]|nr:glycoside hydrolase family 88 protein [Prolixibacteraceae bacterium]
MRYFTTCICIVLPIIFFTKCNSDRKTSETDQDSMWSVKLADAVISRSDSLIHYNNTPDARWEYDFAYLGLAIDKLGNINSKYSEYMQAYIDFFVDEEGNISHYDINEYNLDRVNPGKNLIILYKRTGNIKYKIAIETLVRQVESQPKNNLDGFWHKQVYPNQMWLDGIFMASPFLAQYAKEFNKPEWFDVVTHQIKLIYEKTRDTETGLLYHAWDESKEQQWCNKETGQSKHFWSRATGWYLMALVDVLDFLPENHPDRAQIIQILNDVSEALLKVEDKKTGLWYQVLDMGDSEGNYIEGSGSAMFIYAFAKGAKNGYLDAKYLAIAESCFNSIIDTLIINGPDGFPVFTNICGGCGLGGNPYRNGDYDYYINETRIDNDPKGVAPFIMAALEL